MFTAVYRCLLCVFTLVPVSCNESLDESGSVYRNRSVSCRFHHGDLLQLSPIHFTLTYRPGSIGDIID